MQKVKYYVKRQFNTDIHVLECKPNQNLVIMPTMGDVTKRQKLTDIKHKWFEDNGYKKIGGVNLSFFSFSAPQPLGLNYTDSGFLHTGADDNDIFMEVIYQDGKLIVDDINTNQFMQKYFGKAQWATALSYTLVLNGKIDIRKADKFDFANSSHPRTIIGQKADDTIVLIVSEGRNSDDKGLTAKESAQVALDLGCVTAINADGGGSSTMEIEGKVVNYLSDGSQRLLANGLLVYAKGDYQIEKGQGVSVPVNEVEISTPIKKGKVTASTLNVRSTNSTNGSIVSKLSSGDTVDIYEEKTGWYRIGVGKWVSADYVVIIDEVKPTIKKGKVNASSLNVRSTNSTNGTVVGKLANGEIIDIYEEASGWYRIGTNKWVSADYVVFVDESKPVNIKNRVFTTDDLIAYCESFKWTRKPKELHVHHTWQPDHKLFNGNNHIALQNGMRNYHVNTNKWIDIGQHLTLFPDGKWVLGRDFNFNPASISGRNSLGFAIEMVGNFDIGKDKFAGNQKDSMLKFSNYLVNKFGLGIAFHREYSSKTCPGTSIDKNTFVSEVKNYGKEDIITWFNNYFKPQRSVTDADIQLLKSKL